MGGRANRLLVLTCGGIVGVSLFAACGSDEGAPDSLPTTQPATTMSTATTTTTTQRPATTSTVPATTTTQRLATTSTVPVTTTTQPPATTSTVPADFEVSVGAYRLYRGFLQDVSCTFEVEITNRGPDTASGLVVVVNIETPSPGAISVLGLEIDQGSPIAAGASQMFSQRLGINMQDPVPYFVSGHLERDGVHETEFGSQLAIACNDPYEAP